MKEIVIFELHFFSQELGSVSFHSEGLEVKMNLVHYSGCFTITFNTVLCFRHTTERFTRYISNSVDNIIKVEDSEWIDELRKTNRVTEEEIRFWKPEHYAIYLYDDGLFEFIACDVKLIQKSEGK